MSNGNVSLEELLNGLRSAFSSLVHTAPEARNESRRRVAACLNELAALAGLKPVELGGIPLEDDNEPTIVGEIPT